MKLNLKFSLIITFSVVQVAILTSAIFLSINSLFKVRDYQYKVAVAHNEVNSVLYFLKDLDYYSINTDILLQNADKKIKSIDNSLNDVVSPDSIKKLSDNYEKIVHQLANKWDERNVSLKKLNADFIVMQTTNLPLYLYNEIEMNGIENVLENDELPEKDIKILTKEQLKRR